MEQKHNSLLRIARSEYKDALFLVIFAFVLPFKVSFTNIVVLLYALYVIYCLIDRNRRSHYQFDKGAFKSTLLLPLLVITLAISVLYSSDKATGFQLIGRLLPIALVPVLFAFLHFTGDEKKLVMKSFIAGNLLAIVINLLLATYKSISFVDGAMVFDASVLRGLGFWYSIAQGGNYYFYESLSSFMHPTYWAAYLQLGAVAALYAFAPGNSNRREKIMAAIVIILFTIVIYLLSSRVVLLSTIFIFALFWLINIIRRRSIMLIGVGAALIIVITVVAMNPRFGVFSNISNAIKFNDTRLASWTCSMVLFSEHPMGVGIGDSEAVLKQCYFDRGFTDNYENGYLQHNQFLWFANAGGILSVLCFAAILVFGFYQSFVNHDRLQFALVVSILMVCLVEDFLIRRAGIMFFVVMYCLLFMPSKTVSPAEQ